MSLRKKLWMTLKGSPIINPGYYCIAGAPSAWVQWCDRTLKECPTTWVCYLLYPLSGVNGSY